jgi:hypothetical protein
MPVLLFSCLHTITNNYLVFTCYFVQAPPCPFFQTIKVAAQFRFRKLSISSIGFKSQCQKSQHGKIFIMHVSVYSTNGLQFVYVDSLQELCLVNSVLMPVLLFWSYRALLTSYMHYHLKLLYQVTLERSFSLSNFLWLVLFQS